MNTIGKILVVLNFIFAIAIGIFMVHYVATSTKWKDAYQALKIEADIMKHGRDTTAKVTESVVNDIKTKQLEIEELKQKLKDSEVQKQVMEDIHKLKLDEQYTLLKGSDLSLREALKTKERLTEEIAELNKHIKEREAKIDVLVADVKTYRIQAVNNESLAKTMQGRNELLLEQLQEYTQKLARASAGATNLEGIKLSTGFNPPAVKVSGKIERVDTVDNGLVEITLGTDHGVRFDNTLEVYRRFPEPKYLGTIRIVEAFHHKSVARLMTTGPAALRPQLKKGDEVASSISR